MNGPAVLLILWEIFPKRSTERLQGVQWCIAKNRCGYTLEMRHRRCRASISQGGLTHSRHISAPQKPSSRRLLKRWNMPSRNKNFIILPKSLSGHGRTDRTGSAGPAQWLPHLEFELGDRGSIPGSRHYSIGYQPLASCLLTLPWSWKTGAQERVFGA